MKTIEGLLDGSDEEHLLSFCIRVMNNFL